MKAVGGLERRQGGRALDKLGRCGEAKPSAPRQIGGKVASAGLRRQSVQILANGDDPGVIRRRRSKPNQPVLCLVESGDERIALGRVAPGWIALAVKKQCA